MGSWGVTKRASTATDEVEEEDLIDEAESREGLPVVAPPKRDDDGCWWDNFSACWLKRIAFCASWDALLEDFCFWCGCVRSVVVLVLVVEEEEEVKESREGWWPLAEIAMTGNGVG